MESAVRSESEIEIPLPFQIAVHDGKEYLKEQVDGIYEHREQVQPRLTRHHCYCLLPFRSRMGGKSARNGRRSPMGKGPGIRYQVAEIGAQKVRRDG